MTESEINRLKSDILTEFFEVAFHSILFVRNIYPKQIFELKKKYQIPIHVSKHPKVNDYLNGCLKSIRYLLERNSVEEICLAVLKENELIERFVFAFEMKQGIGDDEYLVAVEEFFRQYILKLSVADANLPELPEDCTFAVQVMTNERCFASMNEVADLSGFPWIEAERGEESNPSHRILPIKSADCSFFSLNVYIER